MGSSNFFTELSALKMRLSSAYRLSVNAGDDVTHIELQRYVLGLLLAFVKECKWCDTIKAKLLVNTALLPPQEAAEIMGMNGSTVRSRRSQYSKKLYGVLGTDIFSTIEYGTEEQLRTLGYHLRYLNSDYIEPCKYLSESFVSATDNINDIQTFDVTDCKKTVFLLALADTSFHSSVVKELSDTDRARLRYLISILSGEAGDDELRERVVTGILKAEDRLRASLV